MTQQPTGTVTFLFTDIEGSTRMWECHSDTMQGVLARHDELLREAISSNDGYIFTTAGDAFSVAFSDPLSGLMAALDAQSALLAEQWDVAEVAVRMALHAGVAHERDGDYFGSTLNRTARILSAGHGRQVLVSEAVSELLADRLPPGTALRSLGEYRLKDLGSPEHLHQIDHRHLPTEFPPLRTLDSHINNLPIELSSFVGRRDELEETAMRLRDSRLVTLTGVGGSGKTRLALQTAAEAFDEFPDGVWIAEMADLTESERFAEWIVEEFAIGRGVGAVGGGGDDRPAIELLVGYLRPRTALLILDNCEHLISSAAEFAEYVLRTCPHLKILATSREGLGIRGEYLIQVPSLALHSRSGQEGDTGAYPDAMELFAERAAEVNARFVLDEAAAPSVADICRRLDGLPLAIELAAARVRMLTVEQIGQRLSDSFRLLTGGSRTALPRQQTLLATVDWSYQLLSEQEQLLFGRLAVFRGGFSIEDVEAIISGEGIDEFEVFDLLASLVDKSMVLAGWDSGRFRQLETLRQFALAKLTDTGTGDVWRLRHAEHFASVADDAFEGLRGPEQEEFLRRIGQDQDNLDAATVWALEAGETVLAARILAGTGWQQLLTGRGRHYLSYTDQILTLVEPLPEDLAVRLLSFAAWVRAVTESGHGTEVAGLVEATAAVTRAGELDNAPLVGLANLSLGQVWLQSGEAGAHDHALACNTRAFEAFSTVDDQWGLGWAAVQTAYIHRVRAAVGPAEEALDHAQHHFRASGTSFGLAWTLGLLGVVRRYAGQMEESIQCHRESADLLDKLGNRQLFGWNRITEAITLSQAGRLEEALPKITEGVAIYRDLGELEMETMTVASTVARALGHWDLSISWLQEVADRAAAESLTALLVYCEEVADLLLDLDVLDGVAELDGFAEGARVRTERPVPPQFVPQREQTRTRVEVEVPDGGRTREVWTTKTREDVLPVLSAGVARLEGLVAKL